MLYLEPRDRTSARALDVEGDLRRSIAAITRWLELQTGGPTVRFDTCDGVVDVTFVKLAATELDLASGLGSATPGPAFLRERLRDLVRARFGAPNKLYRLSYDGLSYGYCGGGAYPPALADHFTAMFRGGLFGATFVGSATAAGATRVEVDAPGSLPAAPFPAKVGATLVEVVSKSAAAVTLASPLAAPVPAGTTVQAMTGIPECRSNPRSVDGQALGYADFAMVHELMHPLGIVGGGAQDFAAAPIAPGHLGEGNPVGGDDLMDQGSQPWRCGSPPASAATARSRLDPGRRNAWRVAQGVNVVDLARSAFLTPTPPLAELPAGWCARPASTRGALGVKPAAPSTARRRPGARPPPESAESTPADAPGRARRCRMRSLAVALATLACSPPIEIPDDARLSPRGVAGRPVEVCVLMQERAVRSRAMGVAEASLAPWPYGIASVLVRHPAGLVVIDPAFGVNVAHDLGLGPRLFALAMGSARDKRPLVEVMRAAAIDPDAVRYALATHVHWDHVGALGDLPNAKVLLARAELAWARTLSRGLDQGVMPHHLARAKPRLFQFDFTGPGRDGFEASFDVFGDGALVAVPLPGHTPGSTGFFVSLPDGRQALLTGDTAWTLRGVEAPVHKNPLARLDADVDATGRALGLLHALHARRPDLVIVPAHDAAALEQLPACGGGR
ncbi:MAG: MBL fold metallo-hydrolase [Myxococcaceae bacterium]|nr:MBL fold metallo-hydrolase [Myxococcaceae bacterium]MCA3012775.1 MBL fold metallo-hydrolase [Myxococcaceae bacterium]